MVFTVGFTIALDDVEVNPVGLLVQLYVLPVTALAPMLALEPLHTV